MNRMCIYVKEGNTIFKKLKFECLKTIIMEIKAINASQTWEIRHKVMWPDKPIEFVQLEEDNKGLHFGVFDQEKLVSIVSCFVDN